MYASNAGERQLMMGLILEVREEHGKDLFAARDAMMDNKRFKLMHV